MKIRPFAVCLVLLCLFGSLFLSAAARPARARRTAATTSIAIHTASPATAFGYPPAHNVIVSEAAAAARPADSAERTATRTVTAEAIAFYKPEGAPLLPPLKRAAGLTMKRARRAKNLSTNRQLAPASRFGNFPQLC